jgi:hypothetical protein
VLASLAVFSLVAAGPVTGASAATQPGTQPAAQPASPSTTVSTALAQAFEAARHIPGSAVRGIRAGSLHVGEASGAEWAIATFTPSASAAPQLATGFQDGAATGVFTLASGTWQLVRTGPYGCGAGLPVTLRQGWGLAGSASCSVTQAAQRAAAKSALSATQATQATQATPADLRTSIASIALGQVGTGTTPAVTSFAGVDCDPYSTLVAGFSANSDGCGYDSAFNVENENEAWCSDFNKWVWQQAGVTADMNTLNAGSVSFYDWALDQGETPAPDSGTPQVGDSLAFFGPGTITPTTFADHVGIVTAVHADGTIDMANGDFLGASGVRVEYDTDITLATWAPSIWGAGEQWVIVTPPATAQQPVPSATMHGPHVAVTGTTDSFWATGSETGGDISEYYWTFGDGRSTNITGADVTHVFPEAGTYTVTVTVTSNFGTITTKTQNVDVLSASSAVAAVQTDAVWFATTPIDEYLFTRSAGGLAVDSSDGASWLQLAVPGQPSATGAIAALSYPDPAAADAMTPHGYYRAADGSLAQTYLGSSGWVMQELPGQPAAGGAIVATTTSSGDPAVLFADAGGHLAESVQKADGWVTGKLLPGGPAVDPASLTLADTPDGVRIFAVVPGGTLRVTWPSGSSWHSRGLPAKTTPGGSLAAVTTPGGAARVFYKNTRGGLAEATQGAAGQWQVSELPGRPASPLAVTNYLLRNGQGVPLGEEVFYLTSAGQPAVTFYDGGSWQTAALPGTGLSGTGAGVLGANAYQVAGQPSQLFLTDGSGGLSAESTGTSADPSGAWTSASLPGKPATFTDRVVLYAATPDDETAALSAASAAGLPASQVTRSFATAWDDTLSGDYLVISVGLAATDALYYNVCGWDNPSTDIPGSTPFFYVRGPVNQLQGADAFENGAASTADLAQQRVTDLAYYAVHGALPPGVTSVPAASSPVRACSGTPS